MKRPVRWIAAALAVFATAGPASTQEPAPAAKSSGPRSILWSKTWESALFEARIRNVPIYIIVSIGEG